jgi:hypothetical protein
VHHLGIAVGEALVRGFDRIDVANQVGDRHVGRGELLAIALVPMDPPDRKRVSFGRRAPLADGANRRQRVVVQLAPVDGGDPLVEKANEGSEEAGLRLAAQAEQDEVVSAQDRVLDLRDDRSVVADDAGEAVLALLHC